MLKWQEFNQYSQVKSFLKTYSFWRWLVVCLHFAAEHCEGLEELLLLDNLAIDFDLRDKNGDSVLHFAAAAGCPMAAYALAKTWPQLCLQANKASKTPPEVARDKIFLEVSISFCPQQHCHDCISSCEG